MLTLPNLVIIIFFFFFQEHRIQERLVTCGLLELFFTLCYMVNFLSTTAYHMSSSERLRLQSFCCQSMFVLPVSIAQNNITKYT